MSQIKTLNGVQYTLPQYNDTGWGANTGNVLTQYMAAIADVTLQLSGGSFTLTADVNFGATYGLVSTYFKSRSANIASAGQIRLANTDTIKFRNTLNDGDLSVAISSNRLTFGGSRLIIAGAAEIVNADISASAAIVYSKLSLTTSIVNGDIAVAAAIAWSKLATGGNYNVLVTGAAGVVTSVGLTGSRAVVTDANGTPASSAANATEVGYLSGVSSAIQTQMDLKAPKASPTFTGTVTIPDGTTAATAAAFGQLKYFQTVQGTTTTSTSTSSATYQNTNITANITPSSTTHRIKVTVSGCLNYPTGAGDGYLTIARGGSNLLGANGFANIEGNLRIPFSFSYIDSPASTSALTYTLQCKSDSVNSIIICPNSTTGSIVLEEII